MTFDGTYMRCYLNGQQVGSPTPAACGTTNKNLTIAKFDSYFTGIIDEVRIYNRALTADEIVELYNNCVTADKTNTLNSNASATSGSGKSAAKTETVDTHESNVTIASPPSATNINISYDTQVT